MKNKHLNVHPGELLREDFLGPLGITAYRLAKGARLPHQRVNEILKERRGITAETDLHLCAYLGLEPGYWLRVQLAYDLREAMHAIGPKVKASVKPLRPA
jgi:addiction module HigA family antidote